MKWERDGAESCDVWPWHVDEGVVLLEVRGRITKDGDIVKEWAWERAWSGNEMNPSRTSLFLPVELPEDAWTHVEFDFKLRIADLERHRERMSSSELPYDGQFVVVAHSRATRHRIATIPVRPLFGDALASLRLARQDLGGDVVFSPMVVLGSHQGDYPTGGKACYRGSVLATGHGFTLRLDKAGPRPGGGINSEWLEFPVDQARALWRPHVGSSEEGLPVVVVYWNSRYPELKSIIDSRTKTGKIATRRAALFSSIVPEMWYFLAEWAVKQVELEGEGGGPEEALADRILKRVTRMVRQDRSWILEAFGVGDDIEADEHRLSRLRVAFQHDSGPGERWVSLVKALEEEY